MGRKAKDAGPHRPLRNMVMVGPDNDTRRTARLSKGLLDFLEAPLPPEAADVTWPPQWKRKAKSMGKPKR